MSSFDPVFDDPSYRLEGDRLVKKVSDVDTMCTLVESLQHYVCRLLQARCSLIEYWIPSESHEARCNILISSDWTARARLLVVLQSYHGSNIGIWSRSACLDRGIQSGSMLTFIERAQAAGFAVILCNPNSNWIKVGSANGLEQKLPISGSASPEEHASYIWQHLVRLSAAEHVCIFGYRGGSTLCKIMMQADLNESIRTGKVPRIRGVATVEASVVSEPNDSDDVRICLAQYAVGWESRNTAADGPVDRAARLGVSKIIQVPTDKAAYPSDTISAALDDIVDFLALKSQEPKVPPASDLAPIRKVADTQAQIESGSEDKVASELSRSRTGSKIYSISSRIRGASLLSSMNLGKRTSSLSVSSLLQSVRIRASTNMEALPKHSSESKAVSNVRNGATQDAGARTVGLDQQFSIADFEILQVIGRGSFGKVLLAQQRSGSRAGQVYAMKVLSKNTIIARGQVSHTLAERAILCQLRHPFLTRLRIAFQSEEKLHLLTDYYPGGSLFYHLRQVRRFPEERAKFYAGELCLAIEHLHRQSIVYRDLKLENVLLDATGHIALTDFGLSKENVKKHEGARTFCGTAEYLAPEVLQGETYGVAIDWWAYGILLYEMLEGRTPFYDRNRQNMFHCIIHLRPTFSSRFSPSAEDILTRLLEHDPKQRLGSRAEGASEIMQQPFFHDIAWKPLLCKEVAPPYRPSTAGQTDVKYVPASYKKLDVNKWLVDEAVDRSEATTALSQTKPTESFKDFTYHADFA